jgi:hypothetical protein
MFGNENILDNILNCSVALNTDETNDILVVFFCEIERENDTMHVIATSIAVDNNILRLRNIVTKFYLFSYIHQNNRNIKLIKILTNNFIYKQIIANYYC